MPDGGGLRTSRIGTSMGHRDTNMLYRHYRDVIKEQGDIKVFWDIVP